MLKPGLVIAGKYEIEHLIAEGGMAELYLAKCLGDDIVHEFVAIKRLNPDLRSLESYVELFRKEALYIITLDSPYIVKGLELVSDGQEMLIVMEYILGLQIGQICYALKKHDLNLRIRIAIAVGIAIAKALKCIQTLDLVHGDITSQNIIISMGGNIKLIDFGVAQTASLRPAHESELLRGTMRFMSPEQRQGKPLTQASDIYSLALVLEEIIQEESYAHELKYLIKRAKAFELTKRYHCAEELLIDLQKLSLSFGAWEPQEFFAKILEKQPETQQYSGPSVLMARLVSVGTALVLITALVIATGTKYFYPRIPDLGLDDHHCENYSEDLFVGVK